MWILIIEDEYHTAERLERLLEAYNPEIEILAKLKSVEDSVEWFRTHRAPDLVFQDIELSDGNCFEIYRQVEVKTPIVFTTAYSEYALEAFRLNSVDYVVKPYDREDIKRVLDKFGDMRQVFSPMSREFVDSMVHTRSRAVKSRFLIRMGDRYKTVSAMDVYYLRYDEGVTFAYLANGEKYPVDNTVSELENQLDPDRFFRINRKYIVSIDCIGKISTWFNSRIKLELRPDPDEEIIVSRDRIRNFKRWLDGEGAG
ncbi:DNA-binding response regulator [Fulvitalea axinellae]|uniref:DNA-binding response regulator n=1 Tax=Fulvitalea axinellae TaxID=1182444 RepID=A0AAU9DCE9_9BACT|nr:DNA-binding response regulator [Fulvitalea axinellae]